MQIIVWQAKLRVDNVTLAIGLIVFRKERQIVEFVPIDFFIEASVRNATLEARISIVVNIGRD